MTINRKDIDFSILLSDLGKCSLHHFSFYIRNGGFLIRVEEETEREHLQTASFIEGENEDPEDFQSDVFTNVKFKDSYNGPIPFLTCIGAGWKDDEQKDKFIQKYKVALEEKDKDFHSVDEWLSEQGFTDEESMYFIEDGVTVRDMTGEDELKTLGD